jgi:hypothetical protein
MINLLWTAWAWRRWIAVGFLAAGLAVAWVGWTWAAQARDAARAESQAYLTAAEQNLRAALAERQRALNVQRALETERQAAAKRELQLRELRRRIDSASPGADGPVAPVLRDTLNGLRRSP